MTAKKLSVMAFVLAAVGLLGGCASNADQAHPSAPDEHTSQSSLDWAGGYFGELPGQSGTTVSLWLAPKGGYRLDLAKSSANQRQSYTGKVQWEKGRAVDLRGAPPALAHWQVGEHQLQNTDQDWRIQQVPALAAVLALPDQWTLVELTGETQDFSANPPNLGFTLGQRVFGFDGCNRLMGGYALDKTGALHFTPLAGTMMACVNPTPERVFRAMLAKVAGAEIQGETLSLYAADGQKLAQFRATSSQPFPSESRKNSASRPD